MENGKIETVVSTPELKCDEVKPQPSPNRAGSKEVRAFAVGSVAIDADTLKTVNPEDLLAALQRYARQDWGEQNQLADRNAKVLAQVPRFDSGLATKSVVGIYRDRNGERIVITTSFPCPHTDLRWDPEIPQ